MLGIDAMGQVKCDYRGFQNLVATIGNPIVDLICSQRHAEGRK